LADYPHKLPLASGLAALGIRWYLEQYAYCTEIGTLLYVQSRLPAFGLAILTMGYQCLKAARTNPAESLKHE
jgi:putative ABC transport system permease protein